MKAAFVCIHVHWVGTEADSHLAELDCLHLHSHLHLIKRAQLTLVKWVTFAMYIRVSTCSLIICIAIIIAFHDS